ncbi:MAG: hypothetical protein KIS77_14070 [Saprospiraceae bacterium]|nr:hypothetical protein [Saprospiraceae bacterium]
MKHTLWFLSFFFLLFAGDRAGGHFLQRMSDASQFRYARLYRGEAAADVLLVGNSRGLTFYQPYIEEVTGLRTFNLSYNGLPMDVAKVLVLDYLDRHPPPRKMVLDITLCDRANPALTAGFLTYAHLSHRLDTLLRHQTPKVWRGGKLSALFRLNNEIFQRALYYRNRTDADWLLDRTIAPALVAEADSASLQFDVHPALIQHLKETVAAAHAKGVAIELVISPYFPNLTVRNLDALKNEIEQTTQLTVRDYRRALTNPSDFGDYAHPNKRGSAKYIDLLRGDGVL